MSRAICTKCQSTGRLLEGPSHDSWVEYYACDSCGHVWTYPKGIPDAQPKDVTLPSGTFRVMQPWGPDKGRQATSLSVHPTVTDAFDAVDRFAIEAVPLGAPSDAIELVVVDEHGQVVPRPGRH